MNIFSCIRTGIYANKNSKLSGANYSIRMALLSLIGAYFIMLSLALAYMTYRQYQIGIEEITNSAKVIRVFSVTEINRFIKNSNDILTKLVEHRELRNMSPDRCDSFLADFQKLQPTASNLIILDKTGKLVCSSLDSPFVANISAKFPEYFNEFNSAKRFTISRPWMNHDSGKWLSTFAQPTIDETGQFSGIIGILVDLNRLQPFPPPLDLPAGTFTGIINREGKIVAASENPEWMIGRTIVKEAFAKSSGHSEGTFRMVDYKGSRRFVSFESIPDSDWKLFVSIDVLATLDPIIEAAWRRLFLLVLMLIILSYLTYRVTRLIVKPIESISNILARITEGDTHVRTVPSGPSEIYQIASKVNEMLDVREKYIQNLQQSDDRFRIAFRASPDAYSIARLNDYTFLEVNDGFVNKSGWSRSEIIGKTAEELNIWKWPHERQRLIRELHNRGECTGMESEFISKDGRTWVGVLSAHLIVIEGDYCILSTTRDLTERNNSLELIHNLSFFDSLTSLPNRRVFMDRLQQVINVCVSNKILGALILLNIDSFKTINDAHGHDEGDLMLKEVGKRLQDCSRKGEYLARIGGDEFAILIENMGSDQEHAEMMVLEACKKIHFVLKEPYHLNYSHNHCTVSLGVTFVGAEYEIAREPLRRADLAINHAKFDGRNTTRMFEATMLLKHSANASMEESLFNAIVTKQLTLHYQPQLTSDGSVFGVEALVRWNDPQRGWVAPSEFIPLAEQTGLILPLGQWVLETACSQIAQWDQSDNLSQLTVAVNVSARQFHQKDFVEQLKEILDKSGARPDRLKLELTESTLISNIADLCTKMRDINALGIGFALDDFGTGYSALSYLKQMPFDQLKIDRSFIKDILVDQNDRAIAKMIITLAFSLNLGVIAEGVETEEQRQLLVELGCNFFQGFLFCGPVSLADLTIFVNKKVNL